MAKFKIFSEDKKLKQRAWYYLKKAVREGKITRPSVCSECGETKKIDGHHEQYENALMVFWLCHKCHIRRHMLSKKPKRVRFVFEFNTEKEATIIDTLKKVRIKCVSMHDVIIYLCDEYRRKQKNGNGR
jgi:hypothetical protein